MKKMKKILFILAVIGLGSCSNTPTSTDEISTSCSDSTLCSDSVSVSEVSVSTDSTSTDSTVAE